MLLDQQPRVPLAFLPTPIQELNRLTKKCKGLRLWIKRDDQTGLALGGNKTRKLEYLLGDALQQDIDTLVTGGAVQSNHCRQTAAAAAQMGLRCELLLHGASPSLWEGNVLLNKLLGAHVHFKEDPGAPASLKELGQRVHAAGHKPYVIPYGGHNVFGAMGYVNAMRELMQQQKEKEHPITHIIFASCSGATHIGLQIGARWMRFAGKIMGISIMHTVADSEEFQKELADLATATALKLGMRETFGSEDFLVNYDYATGYGVVGELEKNAVHLLAKEEGILLDPIYSGRAFGGLLYMMEKGYFTSSDTILFWHTGGSPALFPYAGTLVGPL
ncbi:MAG TPA: D-cysteine desulfhydrase family protein [Rhabdochlamydiaceae bacterium]|jgi:D-cysteine desulfhydrase